MNLYVSQDRIAEARALAAEVRAINPEPTAEDAARRSRFGGTREEAITRLRHAGLP